MPEYNLIQYSKFGWLEEAIQENPFDTSSFFWIDMGISRFFLSEILRVGFLKMVMGRDFAPRKARMGSTTSAGPMSEG
jgi:hypothetical protein